MMVLRVVNECVRLGLRSGAIVFRGVRVTARGPELQAEITAEAQKVRAHYDDVQAIRAAPAVAGFQEILDKAGVKPRKVQPSVERLLSHVARRGDLPTINSLVDAYNLVSMRSLCSLGAHDLDRITLPISLRLLNGAEAFTPLGKGSAQAVSAGEFGYVDADNRVLCWLDVLQAEFSKVTSATVNAVLIVEGNHVHSAETLCNTCIMAIELITRHCGGTAEVVAYP